MASVAPLVGLSQHLVIPPGAFRFLLAVGVVISHISALDVGRLAVLLFFYLSGYWTARIWSEKFGKGATLRYYAARFLRIWPLYILVMVAAAMARGQDIHIENLTLFGVAATHRDPTGVSWSLDIELQFYLILPLVVAACHRLPLSVVTIGCVLVGAVGCWLASQFDIGTVAKYLPAFVLGVLTHVKAWRPGRRSAILSLFAFLALSGATMLTPFISKDVPDPFDQDIYGFFWMLPLLPYVARSLTCPSGPLDRHFGNLSFPLYLVHFPIIALAQTHFGNGIFIKMLAVAAAAILAILLYRYVDRPIDKFRVDMTERKPPMDRSSGRL